MKQHEKQRLFEETLVDLADASTWLSRSYGICENIGIKPHYSPEEMDGFENLTSRFARICDYLINKGYRGLDRLELEPGGTVLDIINRVHKRGLIESADLARNIKELRNEIAHDYSKRELQAVFKDVFAQTPILLKWVKKLQDYYQAKYKQGS